MKVWKFAIVSLVLGLAACGGGADPEPNPPTPPVDIPATADHGVKTEACTSGYVYKCVATGVTYRSRELCKAAPCQICEPYWCGQPQ